MQSRKSGTFEVSRVETISARASYAACIRQLPSPADTATIWLRAETWVLSPRAPIPPGCCDDLASVLVVQAADLIVHACLESFLRRREANFVLRCAHSV